MKVLFVNEIKSFNVLYVFIILNIFYIFNLNFIKKLILLINNLCLNRIFYKLRIIELS